ncbi:MAG TPA: hypothetical protein VF848_07990 [Steroidobacteraceae bacterium]
MRARITLLISTTAAVCMVLASCGMNSASIPAAAPTAPPAAPPPPAPMTMYLDTAAVLAIVQTQTSDATQPLQVDDAAVEITPVFDETGAPINVDAT